VSGPSPIPPTIRVLEGNPGKRPLRAVPIATGLPVAPPWLRGQARKLWHRLVPELVGAGIVGAVDAAALTTLCTTWAQLVDLDQLLSEPANRGDAGLQRRANQLRSTLLAYLTAFGCTPAARARITTPAPPSSDDMNGLLR
jgi:P27 family predicted phage terminase small subunit